MVAKWIALCNGGPNDTTDGKKYSRIHYMTAGSFGKDINRKGDRSRTYPGIAEAMADQWG